jgi:hypothetical protein
MHSVSTSPTSRRNILRALSATAALTAMPGLCATRSEKDSLPMQFYKSLTDSQRRAICLPADDPKRHFVSNWWYVNPERRLHTDFYTDEQRDLVWQIFDSLHHPDHRAKMRWQVEKDLMGQIRNTPSVGFFGKPEDKDFEFIYTGHHVTRRCNAHTDKGLGFNGDPIFYGNFAKKFHESKDHEGNPFWYQGLLFNDFVQSLDGAQRKKILVGREPRPEKPAQVLNGFVGVVLRRPEPGPADQAAGYHATDARVPATRRRRRYAEHHPGARPD